MQNLHDLDAYYADKTELKKLKTVQQKFTISESVVDSEKTHQQFHCVPIITDLVIPRFIYLETKDLLNIGEYLKKNSLKKLKGY